MNKLLSLRPKILLLAFACLIALSFTSAHYLGGLAHADTPSVTASAGSQQTPMIVAMPTNADADADLMKFFAFAVAILLAIDVVIRALVAGATFIAPRTKTQIDDAFRDDMMKIKTNYESILTQLNIKLPPESGLALRDATPTVKLTQSGRVSVVVLLMLAVAGSTAIGLASCTGVKKAEAALIDCTGGSAGGIVAQVAATADQWLKLKADGGCRDATTGLDWSCMKSKAIAAGEQLGGCVLATVFASGDRSTLARSEVGKATFEDFRARFAAGATFRTAHGDL